MGPWRPISEFRTKIPNLYKLELKEYKIFKQELKQTFFLKLFFSTLETTHWERGQLYTHCKLKKFDIFP